MADTVLLKLVAISKLTGNMISLSHGRLPDSKEYGHGGVPDAAIKGSAPPPPPCPARLPVLTRTPCTRSALAGERCIVGAYAQASTSVCAVGTITAVNDPKWCTVKARAGRCAAQRQRRGAPDA
jgi:hypothetical protein